MIIGPQIREWFFMPRRQWPNVGHSSCMQIAVGVQVSNNQVKTAHCCSTYTKNGFAKQLSHVLEACDYQNQTDPRDKGIHVILSTKTRSGCQAGISGQACRLLACASEQQSIARAQGLVAACKAATTHSCYFIR